MFQVYAPVAGDLLVPAGFQSGSGLSIGLFIPMVIKPKTKFGLRPHSWGRDQFNNSNCSHLNIEGVLVSYQGQTGFSVINGPTVYDSPGTNPKFLKQLSTPLGAYSHIPSWGNDFSTTFHYFRNGGWEGWIEVWETVSLTFIDNYRFRRYVKQKVKKWSGTFVYIHSVSYVQYRYLYSSARSYLLQLPKTDSMDTAPKWVQPTDPYFASTRYTFVKTSMTWRPTAPQIYERLKDFRNHCMAEDLSSFGRLSIDAAQSLKCFDGQLSLLLRDVLQVNSIFKSIATFGKSVTLKNASSVFLSYKYGISLTVRDLTDLLTKFRSVKDGTKGYSSSRARLQRSSTYGKFSTNMTVEHTYNMKLYVRDYPNHVIEALQKLMIADFFPTLELVWDIIPFSFVVDWFFRVGDILEAIDSNTLLSTYKILSCVYSRRSFSRADVSVIFPETSGLVFGELTIVQYDRHVSRTPPPFFLEFSTPKSFNHWIEGAALIAQRGRV